MTDDKTLNIDTSVFTKEFRCDRCEFVTACVPDFDPPGCVNCNPELWGAIEGPDHEHTP